MEKILEPGEDLGDWGDWGTNPIVDDTLDNEDELFVLEQLTTE